MARETAYLQAYHALEDNRGYGQWEMLVVLKAYFQYLEECDAQDEADAGWLPTDYDVAPGLTKGGSVNVVYDSLEKICPDFFEHTEGKRRISKQGVAFFDDAQQLVESAKKIIDGVTNVRRR